MSKTFFGIHWAPLQHVSLLLIIFSVVAIASAFFLVLYRFKKKQRVIHMFAGTFYQSFMSNYSARKELLKMTLLLGALFFLLLALLRPQWGKSKEKIAQKGRDLLIALDVSRSMLADDCKPNRLECAKNKIIQLLQGLSSERVGLILFSGSAFVQCPLTTDYKAFELFLDQVDAETISTGTTALDQPIKQALKVFKGMEGKKTKLLIIFTDGEDFSNNLSQLRTQAQKENLYIFALGVGTQQGSPIPEFDYDNKIVGHLKDAKGNPVITHLNEELLKKMAAQAGGQYVRMTQDKDDVLCIAQTVSSFEQEQFESRKITNKLDRYPYFLCVSFVLFILEWLL